jgi:hypothetical protein
MLQLSTKNFSFEKLIAIATSIGLLHTENARLWVSCEGIWPLEP